MGAGTVEEVPISKLLKSKLGVAGFVLFIFWKYLFISSFPVGAGIEDIVPTALFKSKFVVVEEIFAPGIFWKYLLISSFPVGAGTVETVPIPKLFIS